MKIKFELTPKDLENLIRKYFGLDEKAKIDFVVKEEYTDRMETHKTLALRHVEIESEGVVFPPTYLLSTRQADH